MDDGARLQLDRLIDNVSETFFYIKYDDVKIKISSKDFLPEIHFSEDEDGIDYKELLFSVFREHTASEDIDKWDYIEDSDDIGQYAALEIYDYIKSSVFEMKTGKRYWGAQGALSLISSYEFRSRFEGEIVLKGGNPRTLDVGSYLSGVENYVSRNAEQGLRDAYLTLFNAEDKETYDIAWIRVEKLLQETVQPKSIEEVRMSPEYLEMKENQKVRGQLLSDLVG